MKFGTKVIHAGVEPDPATGAVMTPIYQTSTYAQEEPGKHKGYEYSRSSNPTRTALEKNLAALENGAYGLTFGSGMAAINVILQMLNPGDEVISTNDLYGGSYRLFTKVFERIGVKFHFVDMSEAANIEQYITANTKLIWTETPTNPMLNVFDISALAAIAQARDILLCVDNTFATPYLQNPLDLGADLVMHSATKYLAGHSDVVLGAIVVKDKQLADQLYFLQKSTGAVPGPMDCFLTLRGIKTLHLRVQRASENAMQLAKFLEYHPKVKEVYYPGLEEHKDHQRAKQQMRMFGAMVSFNLQEDSTESAFKVLSNLNYFTCAESLGGVESLMGHPATMTHAGIPREERLNIGITDSMIRVSVGVEDVVDLQEDLSHALEIL